jgi:hypothetical protein
LSACCSAVALADRHPDEEETMRQRTVYLMGLVLLVAACQAATAPSTDLAPNEAAIRSLGNDGGLSRPQPHGKKHLDQDQPQP